MTCAGVPILLCYLSVIVIFLRILLSTIACLKKCNHCDVSACTSAVCFNKFDLIQDAMVYNIISLNYSHES